MNLNLNQTRYVKPSDTRSLRAPMVWLPMVGDPCHGTERRKAADRRQEVYNVTKKGKE